MKRQEALAALLERAREEHASLERLMLQAQDEATSDETKSEGKYDTRATEASYLAAGQGERVAQLGRTVAWLESVDPEQGPPHFFRLRDKRGARWFLLAPEGGGQRARVGAEEVSIVTHASPLGEALRGAEEGDSVQVGEGSAWEVVGIR